MHLDYFLNLFLQLFLPGPAQTDRQRSEARARGRGRAVAARYLRALLDAMHASIVFEDFFTQYLGICERMIHTSKYMPQKNPRSTEIQKKLGRLRAALTDGSRVFRHDAALARTVDS